MKFLRPLCLFFALMCSIPASAQVAAFCDTCNLDSEYRNAAKSIATGQPVGEQMYFLMNSQTGQARKVTVFKEPEAGGYIYYAVVAPAASDELQFYAGAMQAFSESSYVVPMPPQSEGIGGSSFSQQTREAVGAQIIRQPWMPATLANKASLTQVIWYAFTQRFRGVPIAIVVFLNGDVAMYSVVNPQGGAAACCEYIAGSARDRNGVFISDTGFGGSGTSSGGSYVNAGQAGNVIIRSSSGFVSCGRQGNGPWICSIITE